MVILIIIWFSESDDIDQGGLDRIGQAITDLITWKDVSKSTLWFGFGCLCFLSSCFAGGINFRFVYY